jgi:hypothetical protein
MARHTRFQKRVNGLQHGNFADPVETLSFLEALLTPKLMTGLRNAKAKESNTTFSCAFGSSWVNFNKFVSTSRELCQEHIKDLLWRGFASQAAFQLAPNQAYWYLLIPVYFGSVDEPLDQKKIGVISIQVKNRTNAVKSESRKTAEEFASASRIFPETSILHIHMNLGTSTKTSRVNIAVKYGNHKSSTLHVSVSLGGCTVGTYKPLGFSGLQASVRSIFEVHEAPDPEEKEAEVIANMRKWDNHSIDAVYPIRPLKGDDGDEMEGLKFETE